MLEHNSFDKNWNDIFSKFFSDVEMYISITIFTLDEHSTQFGNYFYIQIEPLKKSSTFISREVDWSID